VNVKVKGRTKPLVNIKSERKDGKRQNRIRKKKMG
jgi:hypothetical protein